LSIGFCCCNGEDKLRDSGRTRFDVIFTDYGDNSLNFSLRVWTSNRAHTPFVLKSDLYFALFKLFRENGIELPFPQRDLHIRSSDIPLPFPGSKERL